MGESRQKPGGPRVVAALCKSLEEPGVGVGNQKEVVGAPPVRATGLNMGPIEKNGCDGLTTSFGQGLHGFPEPGVVGSENQALWG